MFLIPSKQDSVGLTRMRVPAYGVILSADTKPLSECSMQDLYNGVKEAFSVGVHSSGTNYYVEDRYHDITRNSFIGSFSRNGFAQPKMRISETAGVSWQDQMYALNILSTQFSYRVNTLNTAHSSGGGQITPLTEESALEVLQDGALVLAEWDYGQPQISSHSTGSQYAGKIGLRYTFIRYMFSSSTILRSGAGTAGTRIEGLFGSEWKTVLNAAQLRAGMHSSGYKVEPLYIQEGFTKLRYCDSNKDGTTSVYPFAFELISVVSESKTSYELVEGDRLVLFPKRFSYERYVNGDNSKREVEFYGTLCSQSRQDPDTGKPFGVIAFEVTTTKNPAKKDDSIFLPVSGSDLSTAIQNMPPFSLVIPYTCTGDVENES